jgi:hypothetical protein
MQHAARWSVALGVVGAVTASTVPASANLPPTASVKERVVVAHGVVYRRIVDTAGPWIIHVVKVDTGVSATPDTVLAGNTVGSYGYVSQIGKDLGALVAINGDFGGHEGMPTHAWSGDGVLVTTGMYRGEHFGWSALGTGGKVGEAVSIWATDRTTDGKGSAVKKWNVGVPHADQIRAYTPYGASKIKPPDNACAMRLQPQGPYKWIEGKPGVYRDWLVEARWCGTHAMAVKPGTVVLASKRTGRGAQWINAVNRDDALRIRWTPGMADVLDMVGGQPALVQGGEVVATPCAAYLCQRHPRTSVGAMADGSTLLVVVDGRKATSVGMTPVTLARYMKRLGAVEALNLDGGGGSVMWIQGMGIVNEPSDGNGVERPTTNVVVILPGADPEERAIRGFTAALTSFRTAEPRFELVTGSARLRAIRLAMRDGGSTGGMLAFGRSG